MQDCWPWKRMVHIVLLRGREEEAENKISRKLCEVKGRLGVIREISPQYVTLAHGWHNCSKSYPWAYTSAQVNTILHETLRVAEQDLSVMKLITVQWGGGRVIKKMRASSFSMGLFHLCSGAGPVGLYRDLGWLWQMQRQIDLHAGSTGVGVSFLVDQSGYAECVSQVALLG